MSRTYRKVPQWAKKYPDLAEKFSRDSRGSAPIASGTEPGEEVFAPKHKRDAKKMTRRARRRGKIPVNFKK